MRSSAAHPLHEGEELYFEIGTADGAVGVRGTSVWVKKDNNGTQALAIDSGKDEVTSGAAAITVTGTGVYAIDRKEAKLGQSVSIASSNPKVVVNPSIFSTEAIYAGNTRPLIRAATLRDLADYRSLQDGVGNLRTISMTSSWLRSRDIYSLSVVAGAIGIAPPIVGDVTNFVTKEFANTLPTTSDEKANLCSNIIGENIEAIRPTSGAGSSSLAYWSAAPRGTNACKQQGLAWLADYRKGDVMIYSSGGAGFPNAGGGTATMIPELGFKVETNGDYISYNLNFPDSMQASDIQGKTITINMLGFNKKNQKQYLLDLWPAFKVVFKANEDSPFIEKAATVQNAWVICNGDNSICKITVGTGYTPTQMIFGNYYRPTQNDYPGPIGTTIQSIQIQ